MILGFKLQSEKTFKQIKENSWGNMSYTSKRIKKEGIIKISPDVMDVILEGMEDKNKKIREAAYSTWVSIVELESDKITDDMLDKITKALKTYS